MRLKAIKRLVAALLMIVSVAAGGLLFWVNRSVHHSAGRAESEGAPGSAVVPTGAGIRVRLIETVSRDSKPGEILQAVTADPVLVNSRPVIPAGTRALVKVTGIRKMTKNVSEVTLQLTELISKPGNVSLHSARVTTMLKRLSDVDILARGISLIIGGAVGAMSAAMGRNPNEGAAVVAGLSAQTTPTDQAVLVFQITSPLDVTGVQW